MSTKNHWRAAILTSRTLMEDCGTGKGGFQLGNTCASRRTKLLSVGGDRDKYIDPNDPDVADKVEAALTPREREIMDRDIQKLRDNFEPEWSQEPEDYGPSPSIFDEDRAREEWLTNYADEINAQSSYLETPHVQDLTLVKPLGGSTGASLYQDANGDKWVVKTGKSPDHIRAEHAANAIYDAAGIAIPQTALDDSDPLNPRQVAEFELGTPLGQTTGDVRSKAIKQLQAGFATDALIGNWDVIGLNADNVVVTNSGKPIRVDNGGSLNFRAQGTPKAFTSVVGELESMRRSIDAGPVFGSLTDEDVAAQIDGLVANKDKIVGATPKDLQPTMSDRIDYMQRWADRVRAGGG